VERAALLRAHAALNGGQSTSQPLRQFAADVAMIQAL
jgi:hypothetical protein